ncbi:GNAT family N-acetyltransferase [Klebsiella quasipneumoniae subsp. quasipneumoniae]|uniref:GNAT family N-acetyltransferase n=1 Tax=Klebsiella quasipneumoniae TaxID=1463165 RepID=UPI001FB71741|nr:GNAT family N-acetyltransferase [Klebsiella quasipneumoniae]MCJ1825217.1 GNAT family N-acetyltransferase [Klebsiella quasipneumoniae subsp. quasipneumoniae]
MTVEYTVIEKVPSAEAFCHLRLVAGMSPRPVEGARVGLPQSCYGVHILWQEMPIAMGRIVGDGAINFDIVDVAVDPAHQGKGLGRLVMEKLVAWLDANAFDGAYVTLVADVPELYAKFGFESVRPESEGMARVWRRRGR